MSWRSRNGLDVSRLAQQFGGGGHAPAAGAGVAGEMDEVVEQRRAVHARGAPGGQDRARREGLRTDHRRQTGRPDIAPGGGHRPQGDRHPQGRPRRNPRPARLRRARVVPRRRHPAERVSLGHDQGIRSDGALRRFPPAPSTATARSPANPDRAPTRREIEQCLPRFRGQLEQQPPPFSAIKVQGRKAYEIARAGDDPELTPRDREYHPARAAFLSAAGSALCGSSARPGPTSDRWRTTWGNNWGRGRTSPGCAALAPDLSAWNRPRRGRCSRWG